MGEHEPNICYAEGSLHRFPKSLMMTWIELWMLISPKFYFSSNNKAQVINTII